MPERWKEIPGYPGYEVSDQGRVRSYKKKEGSDGWRIADEPQRILSPSADPRGYLGHMISIDGERMHVRVAQLVLLAFVGPCPEGMEICHNNGDPQDNRLENLRYDTHKANMQDASRQGSWRFSREEVSEIRSVYAAGISEEKLIKRYDISYSYLKAIVTGRTRREAGGPITKKTPGGQVQLTEEEVVHIREVYARGEMMLKELGRKYDRTESAISYICSGRSYSQFGGPLSS